MGHSLYCGVTESGKTTLARYHARRFDQLGHKNIVYDPVGTATAGGGWPARSIIFTGDDESKFMDYLSRHDVYHAHIWVDEAGDHFGVQDIENHWIFRRGRHKGFFVNPIAQRPKMLAPNVRNQCATAYVFRLAVDDANEIGKDFGHTSLGNIVSMLDTGDYIMLRSGRPQIERGNVFNQLKGKSK